jgi:hypothetical protein
MEQERTNFDHHKSPGLCLHDGSLQTTEKQPCPNSNQLFLGTID